MGQARVWGAKGELVAQFPNDDASPYGAIPNDDASPYGADKTDWYEASLARTGETDSSKTAGRDPYRTPAPRPIDLPPQQTKKAGRISMLDIDESWPASVSRDEPGKLSEETRAHKFFVRTKQPGLMLNIDVLGFLERCPEMDAGDGKGVVVHRDVILSLGYHLLDKVHELEQLRKDPVREPRYDEKLSGALDKLGERDAEVKELRAALGEAAIKIRRLESKPFK